LSINSQVRSNATDWLLRFSEGEVDAEARAHFLQWLRASPEHVHAYLRICAFWQDADQMDGNRTRHDIEQLIRLAASESNIDILPYLGGRRASEPSAGRGRWKRAVAAALLLGLVASGTWYYQARQRGTYSTEIGEQRTVNLPDGSSVLINAHSRIGVRFNQAERAIELVDGQALFRVARDSHRPFVVRAGSVNVRAIGTQFDIARTNTGAVVSVVEGKVAVDEGGPESAVSAGEQAVVSRHSIVKPAIASVPTATAWTRGLLVFDGTSLDEVVRQFNRQNPKPLVLTDATLGDLKISGSFPATGARRLLIFLQDRFHLRVEETDQEIRLSAPQ